MLGDRHGLRVLVVDDEPMVLRMVTAMLEHAGCAVYPTNGPAEALTAIREHPTSLDLLLTDVVMPGMSGQELADEVHTVAPDIPVLFMSGFTGITVPHGPIIMKPFKSADLLASVESAIRASRKTPAREGSGSPDSDVARPA